MIADHAMEVHFRLKLLDRATDHVSCHNYPGVNQARDCGTCSVGQVIRSTLLKTHSLSGRSSAVRFQPSHWAHGTPGPGKVPVWAEKSHTILLKSNPRPFDPQADALTTTLREPVGPTA